MDDACTYRAIVNGRIVNGLTQGEKRILLRMGQKKFGRPDEVAFAALDRITESAVLEMLGERLLDVSTWQELLAGVPT